MRAHVASPEFRARREHLLWVTFPTTAKVQRPGPITVTVLAPHPFPALCGKGGNQEPQPAPIITDKKLCAFVPRFSTERGVTAITAEGVALCLIRTGH